jgi:hypothetical protein
MNSDSERLTTYSSPGGRRKEEKKLKQVRMGWACAGLQRPTLKTRWTAGPAASSCMRTERFFGVSSQLACASTWGRAGRTGQKVLHSLMTGTIQAPHLRCLASECRIHRRYQTSSRCHRGTSSRRVGAGEAADTAAAHAPHAPLRRALPAAPQIAHTARALPVRGPVCSLRISPCVFALCERAEFVLVVLAGLPVQPRQACAVRPSWPEARFARWRAFARTTSRSASR